MTGRPACFDPLYGARLASSGASVASQVSNAGGWKRPVRAASGTNITIATGLVVGASVGGVTLVLGDRVLLFGQTDPAQNGIYIVVASGAAPRSADFDTSAKVLGSLIYCLAGTFSGRTYVNTNASAIAIETDDITFSELLSGTTTGSSLVPYFIASGDTFTVPLYKQATFAMTIDNEGILDVEGFLLEVD